MANQETRDPVIRVRRNEPGHRTQQPDSRLAPPEAAGRLSHMDRAIKI